MSATSLALVPLRGLRPSRRAVATRLLLLVGVLIVALIASVLPRGSAADPVVGSPDSEYYALDGKCYVKHMMNTTMDDESVEIFRTAMDSMLTQLGHQSNYTYDNGTLTVMATTDCPPGTVRSLQKTVIGQWIIPAVGVAVGLLMVIAFSATLKSAIAKARGRDLEAQSRVTRAITALGGLIATFITSLAVSWQWEPSLASGVMAIFTTYAVAKFGFDGLENMARDWVYRSFSFIFGICVGPFLALLNTERDLEAAVIRDLDQANA